MCVLCYFLLSVTTLLYFMYLVLAYFLLSFLKWSRLMVKRVCTCFGLLIPYCQILFRVKDVWVTFSLVSPTLVVSVFSIFLLSRTYWREEIFFQTICSFRSFFNLLCTSLSIYWLKNVPLCGFILVHLICSL